MTVCAEYSEEIALESLQIAMNTIKAIADKEDGLTQKQQVLRAGLYFEEKYDKAFTIEDIAPFFLPPAGKISTGTLSDMYYKKQLIRENAVGKSRGRKYAYRISEEQRQEAKLLLDRAPEYQAAE